MRIFFPNASIKYPPTVGGDIHRYQLIKNLVELGHSVHTLLPDQNPHTEKHAKRPWPVFHELRADDVLYCRLEVEPNAATDLALPPRRWLIPRRTVVVWELNVSLAQSLSTERTKADVRRAVARLRRAATRVDAAICVTRLLADQARELLGIVNVHVLQNGSDPQQFRRDLPPPDGWQSQAERLHVVFMASGSELYHDTETIARLAALVDQRDLPIELHVVGRSGSLFADAPSSHLHLHGPISYLELPRTLAQMDVGLVLYKTNADGLSPLKLFDYLASGCVPICTATQPIDEVLGGSNAGLVGQWNAETLCNALVELHNDRPRLDQMLAAGRQLIVDRYSWRRIAEQTLEIVAGVRSEG